MQSVERRHESLACHALMLDSLALPPTVSSPMLATLTDILGVLLLCVVSSVILEGNYIAGGL